MSWGSLSQFSPNLQQPIPTMATLSRIASGLPMTQGSYDPRRATASLTNSSSRRCVGDDAAEAFEVPHPYPAPMYGHERAGGALALLHFDHDAAHRQIRREERHRRREHQRCIL